jgi:hypothetical protein
MYIFEDSDVITPNAANALLKILEEGSGRSIFIFCLQDDTLDTIKSRSIYLKFNPIELNAIQKYLSNISSDTDQVKIRTQLSRGSLGRALEFLRGGGISERDHILKILIEVDKKPYHQLMDLVDQQSQNFFYLLRIIFTDVILVSKHLEQHVSNFDRVEDLKKIAAKKGVVSSIDLLNTVYENEHLIKSTFASHLKSFFLQMRKSCA